MLSEKIISKGKFWFKKDNLVRLEYVQPYQYLMIINKNNIFIKQLRGKALMLITDVGWRYYHL